MYLDLKEKTKSFFKVLKYLTYPLGLFSFLILYSEGLNGFFFPDDSMLEGRDITVYWSDEFNEFGDSILLVFKDNDNLTYIEDLDMRHAYILLISFIMSILFFFIPLWRVVFKRIIPFLISTYLSIIQTNNFKYKKKAVSWFHSGADIIDKGSKWALLITLIVYLAYDRKQKNINSSWNTILRFEEKYGDLGRTDSVESLIEYDVDLVDINLSNAMLEKANFSARSRLFREPIRPNFILGNFTRSNLRSSSFECSIARNINFSNALLQGVNLRAVDLREANFNGAEFGAVWGFRFTDLSFSDLRNAELLDKEQISNTTQELYFKYPTQLIKSGAWLYKADIRGAKLGKRVIGLDAQLKNEFRNSNVGTIPFAYMNILVSKWDNTTIFPDAIDSYLIKQGIRDGNIKKDSPLYKEAEKGIRFLYKKFMKNKSSEELHELSVHYNLQELSTKILIQVMEQLENKSRQDHMANVSDKISRVHSLCDSIK